MLDVLGLAFVAVGIGLLMYGLIIVINIGPDGWPHVAGGGGLTAVGAVLLLASWLRDRTTSIGAHRNKL